MTESQQTALPGLQELLRDGKLAGSWALDAARSEITLKSKSIWGLATVKGVFREVTGNGTVSPAGDVAGTITVAAASLDTKMKRRDTHLRSADFFDVARTPDITFVAEQVTPSGEGVTVTGTLTVRDRTRPVSFTARVSGFDAARVELDGELQVDRSDFGLTWNQMGTSMHNTITVHAVFTKQ
jgi:polyisoprenoid-binding protein YceI